MTTETSEIIATKSSTSDGKDISITNVNSLFIIPLSKEFQLFCFGISLWDKLVATLGFYRYRVPEQGVCLRWQVPRLHFPLCSFLFFSIVRFLVLISFVACEWNWKWHGMECVFDVLSLLHAIVIGRLASSDTFLSTFSTQDPSKEAVISETCFDQCHLWIFNQTVSLLETDRQTDK